jgi:4-amino-4-deoxy-L-arabinose transferase-like glycosyltransferase
VRRAIPLAVFILLIVSAAGDHYFRDEFYYLACSRRMAWGYVDQPPLSIALLWIWRHLAGESLLALRLAAAAIAAGSVWLTGRLAGRLGGGAFAQALAMTTLAVAPVMLAIGSFYSMNVFEPFLWTLAALLLLETLERPTLGNWIVLGVVLGLGLENKISVLWLGGGIAAGLVLTRARRLLLTPGPWIAGAIALAIFAPHVIWQAAHGWPTREFIANASRDKMQVKAPLQFLVEEILSMQPLTLPIWLAGLGALLFSTRLERGRPLGIAFLAVAAILVLNKTSRTEYLAPAFPMIIAAGGVAFEAVLQRRVRRAVVLAVVVAGGALSAPMALPLLPVDTYVRYSRALGVAPQTEEKNDLARLPQFFADREGWDRFVDQIAAVYDKLPPAERASAAVFTGNYGEAGAIEQLGKSRGLVAISGHNNYWLWGPAGRTGDVLIVLSRSRARLEERFTSVELAGETDCGDCMPYENHQPIFICRGLKPPPLAEQWAALKHYN